MTNFKGFLIILLVFTTSVSLAFTINAERTDNTTHKCDWEDCDQQGEVIDQLQFKSQWGYEEHTDGFYVELTHFVNPTWTYEQCEQYVFSGVE